MITKEYLGDSVYADTNGYGIILTTENGFVPSNTIYLEPGVLDALRRYEKRMKESEQIRVSRSRETDPENQG